MRNRGQVLNAQRISKLSCADDCVCGRVHANTGGMSLCVYINLHTQYADARADQAVVLDARDFRRDVRPAGLAQLLSLPLVADEGDGWRAARLCRLCRLESPVHHVVVEGVEVVAGAGGCRNRGAWRCRPRRRLRRPLRLRLLPPGVARLVVARDAHVLPLLARRPALGVDVGLGQSSHVMPSAAAGTAPLHACSADAIERVVYASPVAAPHAAPCRWTGAWPRRCRRRCWLCARGAHGGPAGRVHRLPRPRLHGRGGAAAPLPEGRTASLSSGTAMLE
mmetsp:Transcript_37721/g.122278  ORF Transcript_37721/g.122278 Transcript_37721/m.122278 type:complete len:279 (-) Transcript_37721:42-878(-)